MDDSPKNLPTTVEFKPPTNGRGADGRFTTGNRGGGRPREPQSIAEAVQKALTPRRVKAIVEQAIRDAESGDRFARKWLTEIMKAVPCPDQPIPDGVFLAILSEMMANVETARVDQIQ